MINLGYLQTWT